MLANCIIDYNVDYRELTGFTGFLPFVHIKHCPPACQSICHKSFHNKSLKDDIAIWLLLCCFSSRIISIYYLFTNN